MDARTREIARRQISERRTKPIKPQRIHFPSGGLGECVEVEPGKPLEICIEATDQAGNIVPWLTDEWWIEVQSVCRDRNVSIVILPTPGALFDPIVLHQLEMVRRIAREWRIVGYAPVADAQKEPTVERWNNAPYDEIRFFESLNAPHNGESEKAQQLIAQAASLPKVPGFRSVQMRIIHSMPSSFTPSPKQSGSATEPATELLPTDRITDQKTVESS